MQIFSTLEKQKKQSAVALGFFDGIHLGHQKVISEAVQALNDGLKPTVLTFKKSPHSIVTGEKIGLLQDEEKRNFHLNNMGVQSLFVIDFNLIKNLEPEQFVEKVLCDTLNAKKVFCGFNYHFGKGAKGGSELLKSICNNYGIEVFVVPPVIIDNEVVSSTRIRNLLKNGDIAEANKLLGYDFGIKAEIIHGNHIGKSMGFPTINQGINPEVILPKFGVYASVVTIDGGAKYAGVTNVGVKPTIGLYQPLYETWMPQYIGEDLYGKSAEVTLKAFLRAEKKFNNLDELKQTVLQNGEQALKMITL